MRVAVGSDEKTALTDAVVDYLHEIGHEPVLIGPLAGNPMEWADVGRAVASEVVEGGAETAVGFCWTGTGFSIAANKVAGARAALCSDAETARGARKWNDANVLVMSLRLVSPEVARGMLDAWFEESPDPGQSTQIERASR